jgi:hypothetical protein
VVVSGVVSNIFEWVWRVLWKFLDLVKLIKDRNVEMQIDVGFLGSG